MAVTSVILRVRRWPSVAAPLTAAPAVSFVWWLSMAAMMNSLLALLPAHDWEAMRSSFDKIRLVYQDRLSEAGGTLTRVHFPITGVVSILAPFSRSRTVEIAAIGQIA